jgi:hypothetical protein
MVLGKGKRHMLFYSHFSIFGGGGIEVDLGENGVTAFSANLMGK